MGHVGSGLKVGKPLLQRRNTVSNVMQSLVDALLVIGFFVFMVYASIGAISHNHLIFSLLLLGTMAVSYDLFAIYRKNRSAFGKAVDLCKAWSLSVLISVSLLYMLMLLQHMSREFLIVFALGGYFLQLAAHLVFRFFRRQRAKKAKVNALIVGEGEFADHLTQKINSNPWVRESVQGTVSVSSSPESVHKGSLGSVDDLFDLIEKHQIKSVFFAVTMDEAAAIQRVYQKLMNLNMDVHWVPNLGGFKLINPSVKELGGVPVLTLSETPLLGTHHLKKALLDRVLAGFALLLLSPLMLATAIAIKFTSPGPIFFRQPRTGWDGNEFLIWKFRSMKVHQPKEGVIKQATKNDSRVTRVGRFIRKTSIDELPQLFNVLSGNMSMVGPRPHAVEHNELYSTQINAYLSRHRIKPGITGLAQVRGFRGETEHLEQMSKRVESDLEYINNWSVSLDISILVRTALTLFSKQAY